MKQLLLSLSLFGLTAETALADPVRFAPEALGQDGRITLSPGFSPDGRTLYFAQSECTPIWQCPQRLKRSVLTKDGWSQPELVKLPRVLGDEEPRVDFPSVTPDGRRLLFSWSGEGQDTVGRPIYENFDLFSLDLTNPDAEPQRIEGPDLNRIREGRVAKLRYVNNENAPVLTQDGDLYFWSERLDGPGERDVYVAKSDGKGGFLKAEPLPAPINSNGRDDASWIDPTGRLMLVSYSNRGGEGGTDLFLSIKSENEWSTPVALGASANSPYADFAGRVTPDGQNLVFNSNRPFPGQAEGLYQIWTVPVAEVSVLAEALDSLPKS